MLCLVNKTPCKIKMLIPRQETLRRAVKEANKFVGDLDVKVIAVVRSNIKPKCLHNIKRRYSWANGAVRMGIVFNLGSRCFLFILQSFCFNIERIAFVAGFKLYLRTEVVYYCQKCIFFGMWQGLTGRNPYSHGTRRMFVHDL